MIFKDAPELAEQLEVSNFFIVGVLLMYRRIYSLAFLLRRNLPSCRFLWRTRRGDLRHLRTFMARGEKSTKRTNFPTGRRGTRTGDALCARSFYATLICTKQRLCHETV